MRRVALILFPLLAFVWWTLAYAQADDAPQPDPVILTDEQEEYPLGLHLEILEDPGGELTIEDVASPEFDSRFTPSQVEVPNYGYTDSAYWVRLNLRNETRLNDRWLLEVGYANMHFVDLYTPTPDRAGFEVKQTGAFRAPDTRDIRNPHIVFDLRIPPENQQTYYLRFQNGASMTLPLTLWTPNDFFMASQANQSLIMLYFGALGALLIYNIFLLFSLREVTYLYLVIFLASIVAYEVSSNGYTEVYIIPDLYLLKKNVIGLSLALAFASLILFTDSFLALKTQLPRFHLAVIVIVGVWGVLALLVPFTSFHNLAILFPPWALVTLVTVLSAGIISWRRGFRPARFFVIAWLGLVASIFVFWAVRLAFISSSTVTESAYQFGVTWMAVCWSIALADRINLLKAETENANRNLQNSERRLSQILEGLPLGVVVYGKDYKPNFFNRRVSEILGNPGQGIDPDLSAGRTLAEAMDYFSIRVAGSDQDYPMKDMPVYRALQGEPASVDDAEADLVDRRIPLEIWASPVSDDTGSVESAVVAFQDITQRKEMDAKLDEYRKNLERLVEERTVELRAVEGVLRQRIEWLSAFQEVSQATSGTADLPQAYETLSDRILQLLGARAVSILYWGEGEQLEVLCQWQGEEPICDVKRLSAPIENNFPLRDEIERGNLITIPVDQAPSLPAPLSEWFQDLDSNSLLVAPMIVKESVVGLLGLAMPQPDQEITQAQADLAEELSHDLASLTGNAQLTDQALSLVTIEERNRLARELHDSVTQTLFTASMLADITPRMWETNQGIARENFEELSMLLRGALAEMRSLLLELRSGELYKKPLGQLLETLVEAVRAQSRAVLTVSIKDDPGMPENVKLAFYRIAQEALNNAIKHAEATQIDISLLEESGRVEMCIKDDGSGFDPEAVPADHLGISIMAERAAQVRGDLRIQSEAGQGTEIALTWPVKGGKDE